VDESPVWISINGTRAALLVCSPSGIDALAVGHLIASGWIRSTAEILSVRTVPGPGGAMGVAIDVSEAAAEAARSARDHTLSHGCGPRHVLDCADGRASIPQHTDMATPPADLSAGFRALFAAADDASPTGGVHAAALTDGSALLHTAVDVARHCAVDRVIGRAALAGDDVARLGLVSTSRVSGAIALKAVHAGIAWVASRSVATPLAREIAAAALMPLVEQAARSRRGVS
jgi:FdhD protein